MKLNKKIDIEISDKPVPFDLAINKMEKHLSLMKSGKKRELLWFLEQESIFTAGTSAKDEDEKIINRSLIRYTGRGGQWTWHGKGQRVVYILLNLNDRERDIKKFIKNLELWIISTLARFSIKGTIIKDNPGVWVKKKEQYFKIASIGIRISKWITWHGISINLDPDLNFFKQIIPCGNKNGDVTSIVKECVNINLKKLDDELIKNFYHFF